ncbi:hypothetical protein WDV91_07005 [Curtobacterium flaccumfaciens pv. flaccumfaciens]
MPPFDARRVAIDVVLSASSVSAPMVGSVSCWMLVMVVSSP